MSKSPFQIARDLSDNARRAVREIARGGVMFIGEEDVLLALGVIDLNDFGEPLKLTELGQRVHAELGRMERNAG